MENYFVLDKEVVLVMEYAKGGELKQYMLKRGGRLSEIEVKNIMHQMVVGLGACH
mgnify:CR=1 FL=1